jgi:hypothetical protein
VAADEADDQADDQAADETGDHAADQEVHPPDGWFPHGPKGSEVV